MEKNRTIFEEFQTGLLQPHVKIHRGMMVKPKMVFVYFRRFHLPSSRGTQNPLHVPTEESFLLPLKHIDVTRTTDTTLDVMSEKHFEDYWNVDGERELSDAWTGFARFIVLNEKPPDGFSWSGERLT